MESVHEEPAREVGVVADDLLDEAEEDGDDDGGLEGLAEDDEEDGDGEEVACHGWERGDEGREPGGKTARGEIFMKTLSRPSPRISDSDKIRSKVTPRDYLPCAGWLVPLRRVPGYRRKGVIRQHGSYLIKLFSGRASTVLAPCLRLQMPGLSPVSS